MAGQDYKLEWQDRFPDDPNDVNAPIEMPIRVIGQPYDDNEPEDPEHVTVYIKPGPGYAVEPWGRYATAWVYDDDGGPQPGGLPTWT